VPLKIFSHFLVISSLSTYLCPPVSNRIKSILKKRNVRAGDPNLNW
jgi:hypothetical protein